VSRALIVSAVTSLLLAEPLAAQDLPLIKQRGTLRVLAVMVGHGPEFLTETPGLPPGLDREILDGFARSQQLKVQIIPATGWDALAPGVAKGDADLIAGRVTATEARRKIVDFTTEVFPTRTVVVTRKPTRIVRTLDELRAEKVVTVKGTSMAADAAALGVTVTNIDLGVLPGDLREALRSGKGTAILWTVENVILAQRQDPDIQIGMFLGPPASLAYGVRKNSPQLLHALNQHLALLRQTGTWNRLVVKYFGPSAPEILEKVKSTAGP
jgi:ABC-type amino acid transport substrate-binding protein